jgi:hypothetical protein
VFRTYNASITLDRLLVEMEEGGGVGHHGEAYCSRSMEAKKADYDRANKEVRAGRHTLHLETINDVAICNFNVECFCW